MLNTWPETKLDILCLLDPKERNECCSFFDTEIGYFLALMKVVSQKPKFKDRIDNLIIFSDVSVAIVIMLRQSDYLIIFTELLITEC